MTTEVISGSENKMKCLPRIRCPKCADTAYAYAMDFICDACHAMYKVDTKAMNIDGIIDVNPNEIKHNDVFDVSEYKARKHAVESDSDESVNAEATTFRLQSAILKRLKHIGKKYKLGNIADTMNILLFTALDIIDMVDGRDTDFIGFVDGKGKRSFNLKDGKIFDAARIAVKKRRLTQHTVNSLVETMQREFVLNDIKDYYDNIEKNKEQENGARSGDDA